MTPAAPCFCAKATYSSRTKHQMLRLLFERFWQTSALTQQHGKLNHVYCDATVIINAFISANGMGGSVRSNFMVRMVIYRCSCKSLIDQNQLLECNSCKSFFTINTCLFMSCVPTPQEDTNPKNKFKNSLINAHGISLKIIYPHCNGREPCPGNLKKRIIW